MKILLVDDDALALHVLAAAVRRLGHEPRTASDGDAAWTLFQESAPDVVISDFSMPGLEGTELCRRVRERDRERRTRFILMTGYDDDASIRESIAAGVDDYVIKPVRFEDLEAKLRAPAPSSGISSSARRRTP